MSLHIDSGFGPLDLEQLSTEEQREILAHVDACEKCSNEYGKASEALAALTLALPPVEPSADLRDRILRDATPANRFAQLVDQAARIADLDAEKMAALLAKIDDSSNWSESLLEGVSMFPVQGGRNTADAIVRFVRIKPGSTFPEHGHLGHETSLVLQGSCRESSGRIVRRGELIEGEEGMEHALEALPGPDFVYLAVAKGGITFSGIPILPDEPSG